jgi:hypothetical protein
MEEGYVKS